MKICAKCKDLKEVSGFGKAKNRKDGLYNYCKSCANDIQKQKRVNDPDRFKCYKRNFYYSNRNHVLEYARSYHKNNKETILNYQSDYYKNNSTQKKEYAKHYRISNPNKIAEYKREWNKVNRHSNRIKRRNYIKYKLLNCPEFKIKSILRKRLLNALALTKTNKSTRAIELLGCSIPFFRKYIERKFSKGMSWKNHGEWHLDHIIPCARFDLTDHDQQKQCFHYTNLQPLWANENQRKSDRLLNPTQMFLTL